MSDENESAMAYTSNLYCVPQNLFAFLVIGRAIDITKTHASKTWREREHINITVKDSEQRPAPGEGTFTFPTARTLRSIGIVTSLDVIKLQVQVQSGRVQDRGDVADDLMVTE